MVAFCRIRHVGVFGEIVDDKALPAIAPAVLRAGCQRALWSSHEESQP